MFGFGIVIIPLFNCIYDCDNDSVDDYVYSDISKPPLYTKEH